MKRISGALLEIDLNSLAFNYRYVRALAGGDTQIGAVLKSDAYGLGIVQVANALHDAGCELFFVADLDEALRLRSAGIDTTLVVFDDDITGARDLYRQANLIAVARTADELDSVLREDGAIRYFLSVDTGFSRFGFDIETLQRLAKDGVFDAAPPYGILSQLACADEPEAPSNEKQRLRFVAASELLPGAVRSLIASAGLWLAPVYRFDIARIGSAIYGLNNARVQPNPLRPVIRLAAPVVEVRDVAPDEAIGYGATFQTLRATRLGIVSIGYKHGLPWTCGNKLKVRIGDFTAPVVGRISMEYTTIDLTDVPDSARTRGAMVDFLYGDFGIDEMASAAGVIAQEILLRLGSSCPRTYSRGARSEPVLAGMLQHHSYAY